MLFRSITATATDNAQSGGNTATASISVTLTPTSPVISSVATGPTSPTYLDAVTVLANVTPGTGAALTQVQLLYNLGTPVNTTVFREVFNVTGAGNNNTNWNGSGALNSWTVPTTPGGTVRQVVGTANNTTPVVLTGCSTNGTTTVTCSSTANL